MLYLLTSVINFTWQDISHYKWLLESRAREAKEENLLFVGEQTQSLVMELTALRCKVSDLHQQLDKQV